jgi:hypothetical protein
MSSLSEFSSDNIEGFMIKEVKNMDHIKEFNLHRVYQALIPIEKLNDF